MLIESSTEVLNDNADMTDVSKILTPLLVPRRNNNERNNNIRDAPENAVPFNLVWIRLDQDESISTTATNNFTACDPKDPTSSGLSFAQRNNYYKRHNVKKFNEK